MNERWFAFRGFSCDFSCDLVDRLLSHQRHPLATASGSVPTLQPPSSIPNELFRLPTQKQNPDAASDRKVFSPRLVSAACRGVECVFPLRDQLTLLPAWIRKPDRGPRPLSSYRSFSARDRVPIFVFQLAAAGHGATRSCGQTAHHPDSHIRASVQ